jgi:hypothetical protein
MGTYTRGTSAQIIVGAAALFTYEDGELSDGLLPVADANESYKDTLTGYDSDEAESGIQESFRNVGYTMNGLELAFQPDFGEVRVDQVLDVAKLYKQGMQVNMNTTFAEATLENLLYAIAGRPADLELAATDDVFNGADIMNLSAGNIGECPVERGLVAVGPGSGDCAISDSAERIYVAYRALSIENVTVSAKRDEATMFEVSFRLLPNDSGTYGKIVDRTWTIA